MPFSAKIIFAAALSLSVVAVAGAGEEKPVSFPTNEQMRHIRAMGDPKLSPDGTQVLLNITDSTADGAKAHLWLVPVDGSAARQVTYSPDSDKVGERGGEWMPDGRSVLFLAHRGEHTELFRLPMNGGEAKAFDLKVAPLVDESKSPGALPPAASDAERPAKEDKPVPVAIDVNKYTVSPDGKTIALIVDDPQTPGEKKQKDAKVDASWVDHDKHGSRLYLLAVATGKLTVAGLALDVRGASWSADSSKLIVEREEPNGASEIAPANSAWVVLASDPSHPSRLDDIPGTVETALWTTDGAAIIYSAQAKRDAPPGYSDVYLYMVAAKNTKNLTDGLDGTVAGMEPLALKDGSVLALAETGLVSGPLMLNSTGMKDLKLPVAAVSGLVTNAGQTGFVFTGSSGGTPVQLFYMASLTGTPKVLAVPSLAPEGVRSAAPKRISWKNDKFTIEGMLYTRPRPLPVRYR